MAKLILNGATSGSISIANTVEKLKILKVK